MPEEGRRGEAGEEPGAEGPGPRARDRRGGRGRGGAQGRRGWRRQCGRRRHRHY